jgi:hypothetical protein
VDEILGGKECANASHVFLVWDAEWSLNIEYDIPDLGSYLPSLFKRFPSSSCIRVRRSYALAKDFSCSRELIKSARTDETTDIQTALV